MTRTLSRHPAVIVTDGNERSALAATRSLGRRGIRVFVGAETSVSLAGVSKYCKQPFVYPSPWKSPEEYVSCLREHARAHDVTMIFPMTDIATELLGAQGARDNARFLLPIPSADQYHALSDKYQLMRWAQQEGIPIPQTHFVPDGNVESILSSVDQWPVVVKSGRSLVKLGGVWRKTSVHYAKDAEALRQLYQGIEELREPSLVQTRIVGSGEGVFGLFSEGKPLALFAHRRLREKPPSGGVSVLRESIELWEPMKSYALKIAKAVEWQGIAMVEFKVDRESKIPFLMEVNGRFWGSLQLSIDSGVDFPWLLYQLATTGEVPELQGYRTGIKSRWWFGDLDHLVLRLRRSDQELDLPPGMPSKGKTFRTFLNVFDRKTKSEVMRLSDPHPGICEATRYAGYLMARVKAVIEERVRDLRISLVRASWSIGVAFGVHRLLLQARFPRRISRILVLCKGNICRSPFAAQVLRSRSSTMQIPLEIISAGLDTTPGKEAYPMARRVSRQYGISLDEHRTVSISAESVLTADIILVMELANKHNLLQRFPAARRKTFLFGHFGIPPQTEIKDPYGGTLEEFDHCYGIIAAACDGFLCLASKTAAASSQYVVTELR